MRKYMKLYWKELRFLAGPGIALIVLLFIPGIVILTIWFNDPAFYREYFMMGSDNRSFIFQFVIMPIMLLGSFGVPFMYAVLFLYSVIIEQMTRTRYQLEFLPIVKFSHLITKLAAVISWQVLKQGIGIIFMELMKQIFRIPGIESIPGTVPIAPSRVVMLYLGELADTFMLISLIALGYSLALYVRRIPYLAGTVTVIVGYALVFPLRMSIYKYFSEMYPYRPDILSWIQVMPWLGVVFPAVAALVFLVPALTLYERYAEV